MKIKDLPKENIVQKKSFNFALEVVKFYKRLQNDHKEYVLSRQFLLSGTAIGALIREAEHAESRKDFIHKMNVALKEANETRYWLDILFQSDYTSATNYAKLDEEITQLIRLLASFVKSSKPKV